MEDTEVAERLQTRLVAMGVYATVGRKWNSNKIIVRGQKPEAIHKILKEQFPATRFTVEGMTHYYTLVTCYAGDPS